MKNKIDVLTEIDRAVHNFHNSVGHRPNTVFLSDYFHMALYAASKIYIVDKDNSGTGKDVEFYNGMKIKKISEYDFEDIIVGICQEVKLEW